jgi:hypothetical protein
MHTIPLYKIEEHHEAFLVWHDAIDKKFLSPRGNTLLHVDQHSDMAKPVLRTSINELKRDRESLHRFTYDELGIGNYIYPAVFLGIFDTVHWMMQPDWVSQPKPIQEYCLSTYQNEGRIFVVDRLDSAAFTGITFKRHDFTIQESLEPNQPLVLDIDLDYFSCNPYQNKLIRLEITREQFEQFNDNKYHLLRFEYSCHTEQVGDQYFMVFNQSEDIVIRPFARVSKSQIAQRIEALVDWLSMNQIDPVIIDICRDTFSGYVPESQREYIENQLISKLKTIYQLQEHSIK